MSEQQITEKRKIVGNYEESKNYGFVVPDNRRLGADVFIPKEHAAGARDGQKVVAEITVSAKEEERKSPEGKILEILGDAEEAGIDILSIVRNYELPDAFTERELNQAERAAKPVSEADRAGRMDLREIRMVTIDGEDAKDLDDAVSLSVEGGLYELGVHIADVSNYVQEYSALDREALKRGTSVYLADRVMFPDRGGGQTGSELSDADRSKGRDSRLPDHGVGDPGGQTDDLSGGKADPGR